MLLEIDPADEELIQERYKDYRAGNFDLRTNEIYQLGFRIAAESGLEEVFAFDEREIQWNPGPLFDYMPDNAPETQEAVDELIRQITEQMQQAHDTLTLKQLLLLMNEEEMDRRNKSIYLLTNQVDAGGSFVGADASASWWHRNFRMYANIQRHARPGARVVVIGGQGHTAILKDFLADDAKRVAADVLPYL